LLTPFINRFPGLGDRETRVATFMDVDEIPAGKYFFLEFYCDDEACDCRRVIIKVILESPEPEIIASINYGWEEPEFYATWMGSEAEEDEMTGATLDPLLPQSRHSRFFLRFFGEMILRDPAYVERLKRHYAMFKAALPAAPRSSRTPLPWSRAKWPKLARKTKRKRSR
jgi:hypothetical protein